MDEKEAEIERQQEAQRIALMHGGFTDMIDFEKAMLEGGADFHDTNGYGGMMGAVPEHLKKKAAAPESASLSSFTPTTETKHAATTPPPAAATEQCTAPPADGGASCGSGKAAHDEL